MGKRNSFYYYLRIATIVAGMLLIYQGILNDFSVTILGGLLFLYGMISLMNLATNHSLFNEYLPYTDNLMRLYRCGILIIFICWGGSVMPEIVLSETQVPCFLFTEFLILVVVFISFGIITIKRLIKLIRNYFSHFFEESI